MSWLIEEQGDEIDFGDGHVAVIQHEMTAGAQEDLESYILAQGNKGGVIQLGQLKLLELSILKLINPDGTAIEKPSMSQVRKLDRHMAARLLREIEARNPPLDQAIPPLSADLEGPGPCI